MTKYPTKKSRWIKSDNLLAVLALFFSCFLFFYELLLGRFILTERDLGPYFIPPRVFWVESIKRGDFPLWSPYQFSGHPFFANPQHAILYPLNSLFFVLSFDLAFNLVIIFHFFLGGFFTYLLLKDLKVGSAGSLISGLIFMLSGYLLSVHSLLNCLLSVIWTPLVMMFFGRALNHPGFKNEMLTALFMTLSFLGGGIEIVYGNFIILVFMVIFSPQLDFPSPPFAKEGLGRLWNVKHLFIRFKSLIIVSIIFLLLSAIQLIPFLELWTHSIRGKGISFHEATVWSFAPKDILLFFLPDAYGYFLDMKRYWTTQCWLKTLYTGGLPFILSCVFFLFGKGRRFYLSLTLLSLFLSLGQFNSFYPLVHQYVPFFNSIRYPVKFLYIFILVVSITSGLGFQRLMELQREERSRKFRNLFIFFSLGSGLLLIFLILGHKGVEHFLILKGVDLPNFSPLSVNLFNAKRFLFYLTLFFLLLRVGYEVRWKGWTKALVIFFLAADLFGNMGFYGKEETSNYFQKTKILEIVSSDKELSRLFSTGKTISMESPILIPEASPFNVFKEKHLPTMHLLYRLHDIWGIDVVRLKKPDDLYHELISAPSISATNLLDLYGVKYVISVTPLEEDPRLELIYSRIEGLQGRKEDLIKGNTIKLYRKKEAFPRAWLVKDYRVMEPDDILLKIKDRDFNPDQEVLFEEIPPYLATPSPKLWSVGDLPLKGGGEGGGEAKIVSETNNRLLLHVSTAENSFLVLSDTYFPGWRAYVDGKEEKIYRANYTFRAIPIRAGMHKVEFIYDPLSFKLGAVITLLTVASLIGAGGISKVTNRRGVPLRVPG